MEMGIRMRGSGFEVDFDWCSGTASRERGF